MIPKPPFADDLTLEQELAAFERLKPRLNEIWDVLMAQEDQPATSVVVPSFTLDQEELRKLEGATFYEERMLFLLIRLRNPRAHVVYVTSQPVHPLILDYYLHLLAGVPASHARARLTMLCAYDGSPRPLTQKILERPRLIERIRRAIPDPEAAYLTVFNSTPLERRLAVLLGIPLNGLDPELNYLGTKSGSRKVFREAGVPHPEGFEDLKDDADVERALVELARKRPGLARAVVKLNESFSGEGNAHLPLSRHRDARIGAGRPGDDGVCRAERNAGGATSASSRRMGGVVEEFIDAADQAVTERAAADDATRRGAADLDARSDPRRAVRPDLSGVHVPRERRVQSADPARRHGDRARALPSRGRQPLRRRLSRLEARARRAVADGGARDQPAGARHHASRTWRCSSSPAAGSTPRPGLFVSLSGRAKYYMATDNLRAQAYRGILPEDLIDIVTNNGLHYSYRTESGVLFHLIGALSEWGKLGLTVIANSRDEVNDLYRRTLEVLDREASVGHGENVTAPPPQDAASAVPKGSGR